MLFSSAEIREKIREIIKWLKIFIGNRKTKSFVNRLKKNDNEENLADRKRERGESDSDRVCWIILSLIWLEGIFEPERFIFLFWNKLNSVLPT